MIRCQHLQWGPSGQPLTRSQVRTFYGVKQEYDIRKACEQLAYQPKSPSAALRETFAYLQRRQSA